VSLFICFISPGKTWAALWPIKTVNYLTLKSTRCCSG